MNWRGGEGGGTNGGTPNNGGIGGNDVMNWGDASGEVDDGVGSLFENLGNRLGCIWGNIGGGTENNWISN